MTLCLKCLTSSEHPFHDNGTVNDAGLSAWLEQNAGPDSVGDGYDR